MFVNFKMYNSDEEDEKTSTDPFQYDFNLYEVIKKVFEQKSEEIRNVFTKEFIEFLLASNTSSDVNSFYLVKLIRKIEN